MPTGIRAGLLGANAQNNAFPKLNDQIEMLVNVFAVNGS